MNYRPILYLPLLCAGLLYPNSVSADRIAILAQAGSYKDPDAPLFIRTADAQLDVGTMRAVLSRFKFSSRLLIDEQASRQGLLKALGETAARATAADSVLFYFSGHGARVNGKLSICPYDAHAKDGGNDITETDLDKWAKSLKTRNVTIILDCCFTNRPARGRKGPSLRLKFMGRDSDGPNDPEEPVSIAPDRAVMLTGASPNEVAIQASSGENQWIGVFTEALAEQLAKANESTTYRQLIADARKSVGARLAKIDRLQKYSQNPTIFGDDAILDRPLFSPVKGGSQPPPPPVKIPPYAVVQGSDGDSVTLDRGSLAGVTPGSQYEVYPPGETQFKDPGRKLGKIEVTAVTPESATAKVIEGSQIVKDARARQVKHAADLSAGSKVTIKVEAPNDVAPKVRQGLRTISGIEVVDGAMDASMVLRISKEGDELVGSLLGADGETPLEPSTLYAKIEGQTAEGFARYLRPALDLQVVLRHLASMQNPNPDYKVEIAPGKMQYLDGEAMSVKVAAAKPCWVILLYLDANGAVQLLYPRRAAREVKPGADLQVPNDIPNFRCGAPFGRDTFIALALGDENRAAEITARLQELLDGAKNPESADPKIKGTIIEDLNGVQLGDLASWSITTSNIQTMGRAEAGK